MECYTLKTIIKFYIIVNKDKIRWFASFVLLAAFTFVSLGKLGSYATNKAYAQTIKELKPEKDEGLIVIESGGSKDIARKHILCKVPENTYQQFQEMYNSNKEDLVIDGNTITLISVDRQNVTRKELVDFLAEVNDTKFQELNCKIVRKASTFYLLMGNAIHS